MTRRRGMTLLELIVGLAIGGSALAAGGAAFATLVDRRDALLADADADARALVARRSLASWLAEARAATASDDGLMGQAGWLRMPDGAHADDHVSWVTTAGGDVRRVHLFVDRSADRPSLVADVARRGDAVSRIILARDVAGLEVRYLTAAFGRREWRSTWAGGRLLPGAVVLRLQPAAGSALAPALLLPITVPLPNGR